jgi:organic hydroperoxide reductase OsmC/OhrA
MKPLPHTYPVRLIGGPSGYAALSTPGAPDLRSAPPLEYDGLGDAWSPVSLLLAAVEACFLLTLRAVAKVAQVEFVSLDLRGERTVDRQNGVTRFTEIVLRPRLELAPGGDRDRALWVLEKSKKACLVMAALSTPVRVEPDITST